MSFGLSITASHDLDRSGATLSTFGDWLKTTRERRGLSQRALATKAGISSAMISRSESGDVGASPEMVESLADALEVRRSQALQAWLSDRIKDEPQDETKVRTLDLGSGLRADIYVTADGNGEPAVEDAEILRRLFETTLAQKSAKG